MQMCGGPSEMKEATQEIIEMANKIRPDVEKKDGRNFSEFKPTHYRSQVVAGTNYFIKVSLGGDNFAHLRVFQSLPHAGSTVEFVSAQYDKKNEDPIEYF